MIEPGYELIEVWCGARAFRGCLSVFGKAESWLAPSADLGLNLKSSPATLLHHKGHRAEGDVQNNNMVLFVLIRLGLPSISPKIMTHLSSLQTDSMISINSALDARVSHLRELPIVIAFKLI